MALTQWSQRPTPKSYRLVQILTRQNQPRVVSSDRPLIYVGKRGVFDISPSTALTLLVDIEFNGTETFTIVQAQLEPFRTRGWLTHYNGSAVVPGLLIIVATAQIPFSLSTDNTTYRDIFFDALLDALRGEDALTNSKLYTAEISYYARLSFSSTIGKPWLGTLTPEQVWTTRGQIRGATERGLKSRYRWWLIHTFPPYHRTLSIRNARLNRWCRFDCSRYGGWTCGVLNNPCPRYLRQRLICRTWSEPSWIQAVPTL